MTQGPPEALFRQLEKLRKDARLSMVDIATLMGVSRRTYITWAQTNGETIKQRREARLRYAIFIVKQGLVLKRLPIQGHDRRPATAERRREIIEALVASYPVEPAI